jgi:hypothetical protein
MEDKGGINMKKYTFIYTVMQEANYKAESFKEALKQLEKQYPGITESVVDLKIEEIEG